MKEKQDEVEKNEETKEEMSLMIFEGDKIQEMKEMGFQGCQVGAIIVQAIKDWLISKSAFEVESFPSFTSFYKKAVKDHSTITRSLIDFPKKMTDHAFSLVEKQTMEFVKYILFKDNDAIDVNTLKFALERLVFDPSRWD
ncbi:hypothetical protein M9H77_30374 [Catharanthus roseus]|uniref:Uncharacterized protein n=1 Tax=Catharanthus roseus TaxID=4058 RepID=A0ACB9ZX31_CATRO|nr:hypothetical protein M9H77_30374 [Catharanthus roseus]